MRVKYLGNSGFAVGLDRSLFIFDDISGGRFISDEALRAFQNVTVFVSHSHTDHFIPDIFAADHVCNGDVQFVLSGDIYESRGDEIAADAHCHRIDPGQSLDVNGLHVRAYESTDAGVAFDLSTHYAGRDVRFFHAGDLNNWHWKEEHNEAWTQMQEREFTRIIQGIDPSPRMDLAFFPFDPRMGQDYEHGALQFIDRFQPAMLVPMHFGGEWTPPKNLSERIANKTLLCPLSSPGMAFDAELMG